MPTRSIPRPWLLTPAAALVLAGLALAQPIPDPPPVASVAALEAAEAESFLRTALVIARKPIGKGITCSEKLTLTDGRRTARAAFKTIHQRVMGLSRMTGGRIEWDFRDSWKHDVAAYELDKLLGLGLVPPTVERRIKGRTGALQLWVEGAINEQERRNRGLQPPSAEEWRQRRAAVCLLRELTYDTDYNIQNTIYGPGFRVYAIDFSRGFRIEPSLLSPERLAVFSRQVIDHLRALDRESCDTHLRPWLDRMQIEGLLERRDQLLALVDSRVAGGAELLP